MYLRLLISCKSLSNHFEFGVVTSQRQTQPRWRRPSRQYFVFRSSRATTALHVSKKNITFCFNKVSTFKCKREISGLSSPSRNKAFFRSQFITLPSISSVIILWNYTSSSAIVFLKAATSASDSKIFFLNPFSFSISFSLDCCSSSRVW